MSPEGHERIEKQEQTSPNIRQDLRRSMALDAWLSSNWMGVSGAVVVYDGTGCMTVTVKKAKL